MGSTALEGVQEFLGVYESGDVQRLRELCHPQVRWLDERSGEWQTGVDPLIDYTRAAMEGASEMRAEFLDPETYEAGDQAVVSGRLVYHATWGGEQYEIPCPVTFVSRRTADGWRVIYEHALEYRPRESA
jgi:ketosteroid isomerase-like protein